MTYLLAFPDLHGDVHVWPIAFNIVGIKHFFVSAFQNMAFAAYLAVVQTFPCIQNILQAFFSCWWFNIWCCHIGFLSLVESLLWDWATKWCPGFCHVRNFTYLSIAKRKRAKLWYNMAKILIKSEKLTPFGGFFSNMEQFDSMLSTQPLVLEAAVWLFRANRCTSLITITFFVNNLVILIYICIFAP